MINMKALALEKQRDDLVAQIAIERAAIAQDGASLRPALANH